MRISDWSSDVCSSDLNYATVTGSFYVTGGVTDKIAANVSLYYKNQDKGFGRNLYLDKKVNYQNDLNVRSKILFEPSERTEIILSADYTYFEGGGLNNYPGPRSEERRVGKEWDRTCRSRW